jgi:release factor glutamine methyltransferase
MKIKDLLNIYKQELNGIYHKSEIEAVFFELTNYFWQINRLDLALQPNMTVPDNKMKIALQELKQYKPWQYITGKTLFYGLDFYVNENVLIPRPETQELVEWIITEYKNKPDNLQILDIGCGSGAIAVTLAKNLQKTKITAIDISEKALEVARKNAQNNQVKVQFVQTDIFSKFDLSDYDIIVSNPPYVRYSEKKQMHKNVLNYEPETALFVPDENPLVFYKRIMDLVVKTKKNKSVYFEINEYLKSRLEQMLIQYDLKEIQFKKDFKEKWRMLKIRV